MKSLLSTPIRSTDLYLARYGRLRALSLEVTVATEVGTWNAVETVGKDRSLGMSTNGG